MGPVCSFILQLPYNSVPCWDISIFEVWCKTQKGHKKFGSKIGFGGHWSMYQIVLWSQYKEGNITKYNMTNMKRIGKLVSIM